MAANDDKLKSPPAPPAIAPPTKPSTFEIAPGVKVRVQPDVFEERNNSARSVPVVTGKPGIAPSKGGR